LAFFVFCEENHQAAFFINWLVEAARAIRNAVRLIFYTMSAEVVHSRLVAVLKTA
jgi:hypothetical protein